MPHDQQPTGGRGVARLLWTPPGGAPIEIARTANLWPYTYGHASVMLATGDPSYRPAMMYVEFENVADTSANVAIPTFDRGDGLEYYLGLASSPSKDYLRIAIASALPARDNSYSGTAGLPGGMFNQVIYQALVYGAAGVNGKPFSNAAKSKVYGTAIVATPVPSDPTRDVVWARDYFVSYEQWVAPAVGSYQVQHSLTFQ